MTQQKHLKSLIRARQQRTGESYSIARKQILDGFADSPPELVTEFRAHDRHCNVVRFDPEGARLLTGGFGGQARTWSTQDWSQSGELVGHSKSVNGIAVGGGRVVTVSSDDSVRLWDLTSLQQIAVLHESKKQIVAVDVGAEGTLAVTGGFDERVRGWSLDGEPQFEVTAPGRVTSVAVDPTTRMAAIGVLGGPITLVDGDERVATLDAPGEATVSLRWSRDGSMLVGSGPAGRVLAWSSDGWEVVRDFEAPGGGMTPLALHPHGSSIAVGWEHHVGLWTARSDEPMEPAESLPKGVYSLDFSPDGRLLAQGGADGRVRVWKVG